MSSSRMEVRLQRHLSRRNLAPSVRTQSIFSLAQSEVERNESSVYDAVALAAPDVDPAIVEQQYAIFKIWISECEDAFKPELAQLLYPVFTHLYLSLVWRGLGALATRFHRRHQSTFMAKPEFAAFIRRLAPIISPENIVEDPVVLYYSQTKYTVTLSDATFRVLIRYLEGSNNAAPILLHVISNHVDLRRGDTLANCSKSEAVKRARMDEEQVNSNTSNANTNASSTTSATSSDTMRQLEEAANQVRLGTSPLPSSCLYHLECSRSSNFTCSSVDKDTAMLAVGGDDNALTLFRLTPLLPEFKSATIKRVHLGCDLRADFEDSNEELTDFDDDKNSIGASIKKENVEESPDDMLVLRGHSGPIYGVSFMPRAPHLLYSVSEDTSMRVWDVRSDNKEGSRCRAKYVGHSYPIWTLAIDKLGTGIVTGSMDRSAKLWHPEYTFPLRQLVGHEKDVDAVCFHPNCHYIATGSMDCSVRMWSHTDANMVRIFSGHNAPITGLVFSPNGKILATGCEDGVIRIFDLASADLIHRLTGHEEAVQTLIFSSDSDLLVSGSSDSSVRFWDLKDDSNNLALNVSSKMNVSTNHDLPVVSDLKYSTLNTLIVTAISHHLPPNLLQKKT